MQVRHTILGMSTLSRYHIWYLLINIHKALSHSVISVKAAHHSAPVQGEGHLTFMAI